MKRMLFCVALLFAAFGCSDEPELVGTYVPTNCPPCEAAASEEPAGGPAGEPGGEIVLAEEVNFDEEMVFAAHVHTADELGMPAHLDDQTGEQAGDQAGDPTAEQAGEPVDSPSPAPPKPSKKQTLDSGRVDLNRASPAELTTLPGVGPALAGRIVEYRQRRAFQDPAEIVRVRGIGPATFEKLRQRIAVD